MKITFLRTPLSSECHSSLCLLTEKEVAQGKLIYIYPLDMEISYTAAELASAFVSGRTYVRFRPVGDRTVFPAAAEAV